MASRYEVCVVGLGPVGAVSAACYARQGFNVVGIDIDPERVRAIREGRAPFVEPGVGELIREVVASGRLQATHSLAIAADAEIIMIAVGTPTGEAPDLSQLDTVCAQIGQALKEKPGTTVIAVRSTVPPGTVRNRLMPIVEAVSGKRAGVDFHMASNPEFLREGTAIKDFFHSGRIVIGADSPMAAARIEALYRDVQAEGRLHVSIESAEFAKYVDNTWHALKVTFANEIGRVCQAFGGKIDETAQVFLSDSRLNISAHYLRPGFAFGGSCLPKDVRGLSWLAEEMGVTAPVINAILPSNEEHIALGVNAILAHQPKCVGILGLAFKEQVDDLRESPALAIAAELMQNGIEVMAHDPAYHPGDVLALKGSSLKLEIADPETVVSAADTLVVMHRLPLYYALTARHDGKSVVDLTRFPAHRERKNVQEQSVMRTKAAHWVVNASTDDKAMPSDILAAMKRSIFG